ncbi:MAG: hypothetical protein QF633_06610 [Candidatus Poseidoniaceae archaeon]|nr:hypothetical protein [Candidatus Poseidoniaceae archaeon]
MGGAKAKRMMTATGLMSLLFLSLIAPQAAALGGEASIALSSISLSQSEQTASSSMSYTFEVEELTGQSAEVSAHSTLKTIGGVLLESTNETRTIAVNGVENFSVTFTSLPYGYSIIETILSGDVGGNSSTHVTAFNRTVQRLIPLDLGIGGPGEFTFTSVDSTGAATGNLTVNDGDHVAVEVPLINNGDYDWNGSLSAHLVSGGSEEWVNMSSVNVLGMSSTIVTFNSSVTMNEGTASVLVQLNATGDGDSSDESRLVDFTISPPPLPLLDASVVLLTETYDAGDVLDWNLTVFNNGTRSFEGFISCAFGESTVLNQTMNIGLGASSVVSFTTQARPAELVCSATGMRLSSSSNLPLMQNFDVVSAVFEAAGSSTPGVLDGPWHEGDSARFSMLVRNHGDLEGTVALECTTTQSVYTSPMLTLAVDAAGEVSVIVPMLADGDQVITWRLVSPDGSIDEGLNGSITVPVAPKQVLIPSVDNVTWDAETGVSMEWSVTLGEGVDRSVRIRIGYFDSGDVYLLDYDVTLTPGVTRGSLVLGFVDADRVSVRADAIDWMEAFGPSSNSKSVPSDRPIYRISMSELASPSRPTAGQDATVQVTLSNTGDVSGVAGEILLLGEDRTLYATLTTDALDAGESTTMSFTLDWPEGTRVKLEAVWAVGGEQLTTLGSFTSAEAAVVEDTFEFPWVGLFGGIALAGAVVAAVRIRQNQALKPSSKSKSKSKIKPKKTAGTAASDVKIQIGCPECARQLRVPASYTGSVRCPDCSNSFEVEGTSAEEEDEPEEIEEEEVEIVDEKVEISCPECAQSLRVPSDYAGSVRCPACEHVFKANG